MTSISRLTTGSRVSLGSAGWTVPRGTTILGESWSQLEIVRDQFLKATRDVPILQQYYAEYSIPSSWAEWTRLPVTARLLYESVSHVNKAVRSGCSLFAPASPFDLNDPEFPLPLLQTYHDRQVLEERVHHVLKQVAEGVGGLHLIIASAPKRFAAADLADMLTCLGYRSAVLLMPAATNSDTIRRFDPAFLWLLDHQNSVPSAVGSGRTVVSFNSPDLLNTGISTVDVLNIDPIGYFAVSVTPGVYSVPTGHFLLEILASGDLILTTLRQEMLPLVRYATGIRAKPHEGGFRLV